MTIKAYVYDAYGTLFDVHSVAEKAESLYKGKGKEISEQWRKKQLEYFMLHQLTGNYKPFSEVTKNALLYTLKNLSLSCNEDDLHDLMNAYLELNVYEEVRETLQTLKNKSKKQTIYSNGTYEMLKPLVEKRELDHLLDVLSVDDVKQYKPSPIAYKYALETLGVDRNEVLFMSSNFWDITGAASFGFRTAWINRAGLEVDELGIKPDYIFHDLSEIVTV
ncbi:haloacid dehalogenase type II [Fictibacillus nanhaiensis]|uniref:haloacid dehalogenase type II n=1 Tax=Fictibacillus nanhaiensis TaxID=742169 RepID=UPI001C970ED0|nr:haloacid dehalogenase type II [Fictibacillus nanhaiensis]MBY6036553.1 haloacid dehalogenase type II [Fictibacillus nanhaiensis]